ncbi:LysR family transcriptional regulator [Antarcticimicrobium luteum]|uniref:LysR family transcriptional regulator n=1 Tax=Antarcticimicrobium luteum TaxID=2547397 RepID=A0A4V3AQ49_9RHOB|nr:LysR family transcriptional regulator [Antarcticimicrobium luteum]TDK41357.1 LysR family transcriptional regulator [Antarcticimicrobium luteum]
MDKLSVMKAFCRIVERGSFSRAAEDLGVSAALLSRDVKLLEQSLGCTLLTRTTRTMSLTGNGQLYYDEARRLLAQVAEMEDRVREGAGTVAGRLRVNAPHSFGVTALAPILPGFLARNPDLNLTLSLDDRVVDMIEGGFDLSIRVRPDMPDSSLIARPIAPVRQALFAAPAYLDAHGIPQAPQDLTDHQTLEFLLSSATGQWEMTGPEGVIPVPLHSRHMIGSSLVLRDMMIAGMGIGALPDFISNAPEAKGDLIRVLPDHDLPPRHVYAVTASRLAADAKTAAFLDFLQTALRSPR